MENSQLIQSLISHEGTRKCVYKDSRGFYTIGVGRCIDSRVNGVGLSEDEIQYLLSNDVARCQKELSPFPWYQDLTPIRQQAMIELVFNMGLPHLLEFKRMIASLQDGDYKTAAKELIASEWAEQVGDTRALNLAYRIRNGLYPS